MADPSFKTWTVTEPYVDLHCALGEGPYYERETNSVRFLDIKRNRLHSVSLDEGPASLKTTELDVPIGVTADIDGVSPAVKILVGLKYGMATLDRATGKYEYLSKFADDAGADDKRLRGNDGAVDPHGRFWIGTMNDFYLDGVWPEGFLVRFDGCKAKQKVLSDLTIPNSVGWSPDGKTMYFTHTTAGTILAWDYSPVDGSLSNERVLYKHDGPGGPDGFRVDAEGNIWHAFWGEACVLRISPQGKVTGKIALPTNNVTCPEFVGTELFITTAGDDDGSEESKKYAGGLFRVDVGVAGVPPYKFKMDA
ncbi:hypothetical protein RB601_001239 [Gaeumannomyces tritici]